MASEFQIFSDSSGVILREVKDGQQMKGTGLSYPAKSTEGYQVGDIILFSETSPSLFNALFPENPVPYPSFLEGLTGVLTGNLAVFSVQYGFQIRDISQGKGGKDGQVKLLAIKINEDGSIDVVKGASSVKSWSVDYLSRRFNEIRILAPTRFMVNAMTIGLTQGTIIVTTSLIGAALEGPRLVAICNRLFPKSNEGIQIVRSVTVEIVWMLRGGRPLKLLTAIWIVELVKRLTENQRAYFKMSRDRDARALYELFLTDLEYSGVIAVSKFLSQVSAKQLGLEKFSKDVMKTIRGSVYVKFFCEAFIESVKLMFKQMVSPFELFNNYAEKLYSGQVHKYKYIDEETLIKFAKSDLEKKLEIILGAWIDLELAQLRGVSK